MNDDGVTAGALAVSSTARCCVRRSVRTSVRAVHALGRGVRPSYRGSVYTLALSAVYIIYRARARTVFK